MAAKKKTAVEETKTEVKEEKKLKVEDLYDLRFEGPNGEILAVRKAFGGKPRGRLEWYQVTE